MYTTTLINGSITQVAEKLTEYFEQNGYRGVFALAICGNPDVPEEQFTTYESMLAEYEYKYLESIYTPPLHFLIQGMPATILIVGETSGLTFTKNVDGDKIILHVDKKASAYDIYE